jgi:zinc D-Ala-D-Ala carboxypeptidase
MRLSKNFTFHEMVRSQTATRHGVDNAPSPVFVENLRLLCVNVLQPIRDHYGLPVDISSGYRSPALNRLVKGSKTSDHMRGMAADIEIQGVSNWDLANWIKDRLKFKQCILEYHTRTVPDSGWVHVSYDPLNLRNEFFSKPR